jgi:hypothetical protein
VINGVFLYLFVFFLNSIFALIIVLLLLLLLSLLNGKAFHYFLVRFFCVQNLRARDKGPTSMKPLVVPMKEPLIKPQFSRAPRNPCSFATFSFLRPSHELQMQICKRGNRAFSVDTARLEFNTPVRFNHKFFAEVILYMCFFPLSIPVIWFISGDFNGVRNFIKMVGNINMLVHLVMVVGVFVLGTLIFSVIKVCLFICFVLLLFFVPILCPPRNDFANQLFELRLIWFYSDALQADEQQLSAFGDFMFTCLYFIFCCIVRALNFACLSNDDRSLIFGSDRIEPELVPEIALNSTPTFKCVSLNRIQISNLTNI